MKRIASVIIVMAMALTVVAQQRKVQNKPYIDMRPMHFGIHVGLNMQDVEFQNVGPQQLLLAGMEESVERTVLCDAETWNPGFSVGVVADMRLSQYLNLRVTPTMHFGSKHLVFRDMDDLNGSGIPRETTQDMKNTYIAFPTSMKFSAERFNNYRPYLMAGISPMINLSGKDQDFLHLKRFDAMLELGLGCDYYLPFFKLIPELKFCFSLSDVFDKSHADELTDANKQAFARSVNLAMSKMIVLTFYFE
jgi:hypothetical protein